MAVYPLSPGHPDHSSSGPNKYIASVYSALLVKNFYPRTIWGRICNTDYEGEISDMGDTVDIRTRPTISTFRYKKGMVLPVQNPESPYVQLKIDQGEGFSIGIEKVDEFQSDIDLQNEWGADGAEQLKQVIDRNVLISVAAAGAAAGGQAKTTIVGYNAADAGPDLSGYTAAKGAIVNGGTTTKGTTISLGTSAAAQSANTGDKITELVLYYNRMMDENNLPDEGRFVIFPTFAGQRLKSMTSNAFGLAYATGQNSAALLSGNIPKIDRSEILFSNNMPTTTEGSEAAPVLFGINYATTFATQITESRIIDNPFAWGKLMQGLQVYGFSIIKPLAIGVDFIKNA